MKPFALDVGGARRPLDRYWELCVGSCHAATALRADYQAQLARCQRELGFRYVRFHGLLNDDMSVVLKNMYTQQLSLSFTNIDKVFDFLLSINMRPFVELSFMPEALASGNKTLFHYKGNTTPPKDYAQWNWLVGALVEHLLARYGRGEVRQWFFEVWNEPNLGGPESPFGFWSGTKEEYFKLYRETAQTIKQADPFLRVGGPATSNNAWIPDFLDFCRQSGAPVDFVTTHHYPTDIVVGYGVEDSANFQSPIDMSSGEKLAELFRKAKEDPEFLQKKLQEYSVFQSHLWEHVDRGVLTDMDRRARAEAGDLPLYYTEWGSLAGLPSDGPFGASFIPKTILDSMGLAQGYSFWTFSDIFEENGQPSAAFHGGFGLLTHHGIPKAPYRAFQLLHELGGELYEARFSEGTVDGYAAAKPEAGAVQLLLVNHHSLLHDIEAETVAVRLSGCGACVGADIQRIDDSHANALAAWQAMGSPEYLTPGQVSALAGASELAREAQPFAQEGDAVSLEVALPPMGTAVGTLYFA